MTPELLWWYVQLAVTIAGPWTVPKLAGGLLDWPWHRLLSGFSGALACGLTWFILRRLQRGLQGRYTRLLGFCTFVLALSVGWSVSWSVHVWQDFGQAFIPAAVG